MESISSLKLNLEKQLSELEMLQSIFSKPGELNLNHASSVVDIDDFVKDKNSNWPPNLDFTIKLTIDDFQFEFCVCLPHEYPETKPQFFIRNEKQTRDQQHKMITDLISFIDTLESGEVCIYSAVNWLQDNALNYVNLTTESVTVEEEPDEYSRFWIYSHHIYNNTKRRDIIRLANEYHLTGFCLPGKPGVICIEGLKADCESWWLCIKSMCWKRIICKLIETETCLDVNTFRKFNNFEELSFQCHNNHMDLGNFAKYLIEHNCGSVFNDVFGLENK